MTAHDTSHSWSWQLWPYILPNSRIIGSWGKQITNSDFAIESAANLTLIVGVFVITVTRADGDDGGCDDCNGDHGDGYDSDCDDSNHDDSKCDNGDGNDKDCNYGNGDGDNGDDGNGDNGNGDNGNGDNGNGDNGNGDDGNGDDVNGDDGNGLADGDYRTQITLVSRLAMSKSVTKLPHT